MRLTAQSALNRLTISRSALTYNVETLRSHLPLNTQMMMMVKGNAYGSDPLVISHVLSGLGIRYFGVDTVEEGEELRAGGIEGNILVLYCPTSEAERALSADLQIAAWSADQLSALEEAGESLGKTALIHLFINTGMNRLGCRPREVDKLAEQIGNSPHLQFHGLMTHLANSADPEGDPMTERQLADFRSVLERLDAPLIHVFNSAGAVRFSFPEGNLVRIGLALYGIYDTDTTRDALPLRNVLSLTSRLGTIQVCQPGETVSYGSGYVVEKETRIGVIPIGYFGGIHLIHSGKSVVHIHGKPAPLVGTICMNYTMCDLSAVPEATVGDEVVIFNEKFRPETFASSAGRSVYELLTCIGSTVHRELVD